MNPTKLVGQISIPSPITKIIVSDYYDGLIEGVAEYDDGSFVVMRLLDWDNHQDIRVYGVYDIDNPGKVDKVKDIFSNVIFTTPMINGIESVLGKYQCTFDEIIGLSKGIPDYIIVTQNIFKQILQCVTYPGGDVKRDWLAEMGIPRDPKKKG